MIRRVVARTPTGLTASPEILARRYDVALLDLDGVVYLGRQAIEGVPEALARVREQGMRLAFVTNNAARPARLVAEQLVELGVPAVEDEVVTSAQAAAHYLADRLPSGAKVLVVGASGLDEALAERGLVAVHRASDEPVAVVQGYSPELSWAQLAEGAVAIRRGVPWVATNLDATVPSDRGPLPGNGSLVAALRHATGAEPVSTGKPDPTMHRESVARSGAQRPIVVGDRLDTDIEGANAAGCPSLLVLSGVTAAQDLLAAPEQLRPRYLSHDVGGLLHAHRAPVRSDRSARCGAWRAELRADGTLALAGPDDSPSASPSADHGVSTGADAADGFDISDRADGLDGLRALCTLSWADGGPAPSCVALDRTAEELLATLGLV
jgi:HAD superfamily hydrolase (TIGR01450 family)